MKSLLVLSVLWLVTNATLDVPIGRAGNHNLILCDNVDKESGLTYSQLFTREALFLHTRTETVSWPISGLNFRPITCIKVLDQIPNNWGGYVQHTRGGVGNTFVELVFTSQWSRRMSFLIEIYTKPEEDLM